MMTEQATDYDAGASLGLEMLAERMAQDPRTMAWVLEHYRRQEGMSRERLCDMLGVTLDGYLTLATCLAPSREHFADHLRQIADYTRIDGLLLGNLIRQVDALAKHPARTVEQQNLPAATGHRPALPASRSAPLMAARDRLNEEVAPYASVAPQETPLDGHPSDHHPSDHRPSDHRPSDASPASGDSPDDSADSLAGHRKP